MPDFIEIIVVARDLASGTVERAADKMEAKLKATKTEAASAGQGIKQFGQELEKAGVPTEKFSRDLEALGSHSVNAGNAMERMTSRTIQAGTAAETSARRHDSLIGSIARLLTLTRQYVGVQAAHYTANVRQSTIVQRLERDYVRLRGAVGAVVNPIGAFASGALRAATAARGWSTEHARLLSGLVRGVALFAALTAATYGIAGALGGATAAVTAFTGALLALAGAAVVLPAAIGAIGGALAALVGIIKPATSGIFEFIQASDAAQKQAGGGGGGAAGNARQIADAERQLARTRVQAAQQVADAERQLARTRHDAIVQNRQAEIELRQTRISAINDVIAAEERLQQVIEDNARQRRELQQNLADAQASLAGEKARGGANVGLAQAGVTEAQSALDAFNQDAARTQAQAQRDLAQTQIDAISRIQQAEDRLRQTQIENARQIADAERNLARQRVQAAQSVADAERNVAEQRRQAGAAGAAGADAVAQALAQLSPLQRQIAQEILLIKDRWDQLTAAARNRFLRELLLDLEQLNRNLPRIAQLVAMFSDGFVHAMRTIRQSLDDPVFVAALDRVGVDLAKNFDVALQAGIKLGRGFVFLLDGARPFLDWITRAANQWARYFENAMKSDDANGRLGRFFRAVRQSIHLTVDILRDFGKGLFNIFTLSFPAGRGLLRSLADLAHEFRNFTESPQGQRSIRDFINNGLQIFHALARVLETFAQGFGAVIATSVETNGPLTLFLDTLNALLKLPFAGWVTAAVIQVAILTALIGRMNLSLLATAGRGLAAFVLGLGEAVAGMIGLDAAVDTSTVLFGIFGVTVELALLPLIAIGAAIAGLILLGVALWQNWFDIRGKLRAVWDHISDAARTFAGFLERIFGRAWDFIKNLVIGHWQDIVAFLGGPLGWAYLIAKYTGLWDTVRHIFGDAWDWISNHISSWWHGLTGWVTNTAAPAIRRAFSGLWDGVKNVVREGVNGVIHLVESFINKLISGVNWILRHIGLSGQQIGSVNLPTIGGGGGGTSTPPHPALRRGVPQFESGGVVPGPEGRPQLILAHGGEVVLNRDQQEAQRRGVPGGGFVSDIVGGVLGAAGDVASFIAGIAGDVTGFISDHLPSLPDFGHGVFGLIAHGLAAKALHGVTGWIKKKIEDLLPSIGGGGGAAGSVTIDHAGLIDGKWGGINWGTLTPDEAARGFGSGPVGYAPGDRLLSSLSLRQVLAAALDSLSLLTSANLTALTGRALQESGGHTGIINQNDINWQHGIPSIGLLQTIFGTFLHYAATNLRNILDPFHNAVAAIRYMIANYHRIVGPSGTGYALGGIIGEREGWMGMMGQAVPIMAHVGEWVLNPSQQLRLASIVGGLDRARQLLFERTAAMPQTAFAGGGIVSNVSPWSASVRPGRDVSIEMPVYTTSPTVDVDYVAARLEQIMQGHG